MLKVNIKNYIYELFKILQFKIGNKFKKINFFDFFLITDYFI